MEAGGGDKVAFHWEGEPGDTRTITYRELLEEVLDLVPDAWLEPAPGAENPGALRSAYVDFLLARVSGSRAWLPVAGAA